MRRHSPRSTSRKRSSPKCGTWRSGRCWLAEAGADTATLAAAAVEHGTLDRRGDAVAAAILADAGARAAAHLVEVNLVVTPDDERVKRARAAAEVASAAARSAVRSSSA
jgi:formiminotetrahydrofolate cyclodeaminase